MSASYHRLSESVGPLPQRGNRETLPESSPTRGMGFWARALVDRNSVVEMSNLSMGVPPLEEACV